MHLILFVVLMLKKNSYENVVFIRFPNELAV